jgi:hypothetical protein
VVHRHDLDIGVKSVREHGPHADPEAQLPAMGTGTLRGNCVVSEPAGMACQIRKIRLAASMGPPPRQSLDQ